MNAARLNTALWITMAPLLALGCRSTRFGNDPDGSVAVVVNDDMLVSVPEADRENITRARTERSEMKDRVAMAERDAEQGRRQLDVTEEELEAAEDAVTTAEKGLEVARDGNENARASEMESANRKLETARTRLYLARSRVAHGKTQLSRLESETDLANLRLQWSEACVELAKAKAVHELDRPEAREISVRAFEARVADRKIQVALAEIDTQAWEQKVQVRQDALEEQQSGLVDSRDQQH